MTLLCSMLQYMSELQDTRAGRVVLPERKLGLRQQFIFGEVFVDLFVTTRSMILDMAGSIEIGL